MPLKVELVAADGEVFDGGDQLGRRRSCHWLRKPLAGQRCDRLHAIELLADDPRVVAARVHACHQLTPELADDVNRAGLVALIDTSVAPQPAGLVATRQLVAAPPSSSAFSHHVEPMALLEIAMKLFGRALLLYR